MTHNKKNKESKFNNPQYYVNREWSWLEFNNRVLYEAYENINPVLERLKFTSIVSSNLEEFFMVRVAGLKKLLQAGLMGHSPDNRTPLEQLQGIRKRVIKMLQSQYYVFYKEIIPELKKSGVELLLNKREINLYQEKLRVMFENDILPVLTPISVSPTHPFPNLNTGRLYLAVELEEKQKTNELLETSNLSFVEIPINIYGRFIMIEKYKFIPIEKVISLFVSKIYNGYKVLSANIIKVTRDADFVIEEDAVSDLLLEIESTIKRMHSRSIVKIEYEKGLSQNILKTLMENSQISDDDIYVINGMLNLNDLMGLYQKIDRAELKEVRMDPVHFYNIEENDIFDLIKQNDFLLYHPYHSYDPIVELIDKAADDKQVLAIKQLLYRTSTNSSIINALIRAAEKGKHVSVVVELKARFDERQNIEWAKTLEDSGAHVIYGLSGLKTHGKALLIIRKEKNGVKRYIHFGTGNYNETTAKLYTDFSLFTCDELFGEDVSSLFNLLTGFSLPVRWNHITIAPLDLREKFISLINRETENAKKGLNAQIIAKMNSLADIGIAQALYSASQAGVKIKLIIRGICIANPGIKNVSENITIKSIIGKYLEHSRIYYFYNNGESEYYLSSADWMTRNLDGRIELLFPILDQFAQEMIKKILDIQIKDTKNSWEMNNKGEYQLSQLKNNKDSFNLIYQYVKKQSRYEVADENLILSKIKQQESVK